jgi:hypothetical protein
MLRKPGHACIVRTGCCSRAHLVFCQAHSICDIEQAVIRHSPR